MLIKFAFILFFLITFHSFLYAKEELVIVQTVSSSRKTFVLQLGLKNGIAKGQEVIFSSENSSLVCKAIEVQREYSLWAPLDKYANVPFSREDIVSMNTHAFGNVSVDVASGKDEFFPEDTQKKEFIQIHTENDYSFRYSYGAALSQSSSSVSTTQNSHKKSENFVLEYGYRFIPEIEVALGYRYDYAVYRLSSPELDIPTSRNFLMANFVYHFLNLTSGKNTWYTAISLGIGKSSTTINENTSSGIATVLPEVRIGYHIPLTKSKAMVVEVAAESVSAKEEFTTGESQENSEVNLKMSLGLRF